MWIKFDVDEHGCCQGRLALMWSPIQQRHQISPTHQQAMLEDGECP